MHPDNLDELLEILRETGAEGIFILRGATSVRITFTLGAEATQATLDIADAGIILIARLPADGREAGLEVRP